MTKTIDLVYSGNESFVLKAGEFRVINTRLTEAPPENQVPWFSELKTHMRSGLVVSPQSTYLGQYETTGLDVRVVNIHRTPRIMDVLNGTMESKEIQINPGDILGTLNWIDKTCFETSESA